MSSILRRLSDDPKSDLFGGLTAAVTALPLALAFGVMVTNELGPEWRSVGAVAGLYGAIFTGFFASMLGGTPSQVTGPTGPMTTVMAGVVGGLVAGYSGQLEAHQMLTVAFLCVVLAGLMQIGLGVVRLGTLVNYIPYPVVAGFMNGIAVIIFLGQRKPFVGMEDGTFDIATTLVGVATVAIIMLTPKVTKAVPGSLVGLGLGTALYYLAKAGNAELGPVVGEVPTALPSLDTLRSMMTLPTLPVFRELLPMILGGAASLAILGAIDSLLTSVVADTVTKTRHDSNQELIGQGVGNTIAGLFGGFAGAGATIRTLVNINAGGKNRLSGMAHSMALFVVVVAVGSTAGKIPTVVLSAILMVTAWGMLDRWSGGLLLKLSSASRSRKEISINLALVILVTVITVVVDLMVAVAIGLVLASLYFVLKSGDTVIRGIYTGADVSSRRVYPQSVRGALDEHGRETLVVALQGELFFGSSSKFTRVVESTMEQTTRRVILDLSRCTGIDSSGGLAIAQLQDTIKKTGRQLAIAGLPRDSAQWALMQDLGIVNEVNPDYFFPDLDRALEWSETLQLEELGTLEGSYQERQLTELELFKEFTPQEMAVLEPHLTPIELQSGEYLYRTGDKPCSVIFVTAGSLEVYSGEASETGIRLAHYGPGSTVGEVSLLHGAAKAANAVADLPFKGRRLTRESLETLQKEHPQVCSHLLWVLGRELAQRVRDLRAEVQTLMG